MAFDVGLGGCKNFFLAFASGYAIINSGIEVIDWKVDTAEGAFKVKRAAASIGADAGKIYLAVDALVSATFVVSQTWVLIAFLTAVFSLTKILMDSYEESRKKKEPFYPAWMDPMRMVKA